MKLFSLFRYLPALVLFVLSSAATCAQAQDHVIFDDAPRNTWDNWSWAKNDLKNAKPARGAASMRVQAGPWTAVYWQHKAFDTSRFQALSFWIHGGDAGGQKLRVLALRATKPQTGFDLPPLQANAWKQITVPLAKLGIENVSDFDGFYIQDAQGKEQPVFYVDDIRLVARAGGAAPQPAPPAGGGVLGGAVTVQVNAAAAGTPISPLIYGVNLIEGDIAGVLSELNAPINRWGGNLTSRYNWKQNASNHARDWFFQSIPQQGGSSPGASADYFIRQTRAAKAQAMLTIPLIGWVGKLGPNRDKTASFSVAKYGPQKSTDAQWMPDAGDGIKRDGSFVKNNDPNDANVKAEPAFMEEWIKHLQAKWGKDTPRYYLYDNEAGLWHETHRDVRPNGVTMKEMRDLIIQYGTRIRKLAPNALLVGPQEWGWLGYKYSSADILYQETTKRYGQGPDREANGNVDYIPWLLKEIKAHEKKTGVRLLDVLSVHYYPQGGEDSDDVSEAMQLQRARSTRSLWDPNYVDQSWIKEKINLLPRIKKWAQDADPTLQLAVTEYRFGAENHISGALAQAEVLGIFGREGLHIAARWVAPKKDTLTWNAMKMFRNYNGSKASFGDKSLPTTFPDPDTLSAFATRRSSDGALTIMVLNKRLKQSAPLRLQIAGYAGNNSARYYQFTSQNVITNLPNVAVKAGGVLETTLPPQSINLFVLPGK